MNPLYGDWPHRWFGYWREGITQNSKFPLIGSFVDPGCKYSEQSSLLKYLCRCQPILLTSSTKTSCLFSDCQHRMVDYSGSMLIEVPMTDGTWIWSSELCHYVQFHNVRLLDAMYEHIKAKEFKPPGPLKIDGRSELVHTLDWPFVPPPIQRVLTDKCNRNQVSAALLSKTWRLPFLSGPCRTAFIRASA